MIQQDTGMVRNTIESHEDGNDLKMIDLIHKFQHVSVETNNLYDTVVISFYTN